MIYCKYTHYTKRERERERKKNAINEILKKLHEEEINN